MRPIASARWVLANRVWLAALFSLSGAGWVAPALAQNAVCADVKIEIKQKLSLERQAFDAVMRINNGLQTDAIQDVRVNLTFQDQAGNAVVATCEMAYHSQRRCFNSRFGEAYLGDRDKNVHISARIGE